jgi:hypothetical protein
VVHPVSLGMSELRYTRSVYRDQRGSDGSEELIVSECHRSTRVTYSWRYSPVFESSPAAGHAPSIWG